MENISSINRDSDVRFYEYVEDYNIDNLCDMFLTKEQVDKIKQARNTSIKVCDIVGKVGCPF